MKIVCGDCGYIKALWDNHQNCLSCTFCSRLSTCSTCSPWSEEAWVLADRHCTYSARKSLMAKKKQNKKERRLAVSDLSDDNSLDGSTTPQGYTARGKNHQGGDYSDAECIQNVSPPVTGQPTTSQPVTGQPVTGQSVTGQPINGQPGTGQFITSQPGTGQPVTGHSVTSHSVITRHRSPVTGHLITRHPHQSPVNQSLVTSQLTRHRSSCNIR